MILASVDDISETVPLSAPDLRGREAEYLQTCVRDNWVSSAGPFVVQMEKRLAEITGQRHAVATVTGTAALHLALIVAGVRPGDYVIVPDWTFAATANAVFHAGGSPILVDITPESWTLDPELVSRTIADFKDGRIAAVVAVDALGHPADMDALAEVCAGAGVPLVEDAAGAVGARYRGRPAGGLGDIGVFSFNGNKTVTAGGGGMIVTDDGTMARAARHLSTQARPSGSYEHDQVGYNYRMTNLNAAVGLAQIERLGDLVAAKRAIAARYDDALAGRADLVPMPRADWAESNCWLYSVLCENRQAADSLVVHLAEHGIQARDFWHGLSTQAPYRAAPHRLAGVSGDISGRVVSLPSSSGMTAEQMSRVLRALRAWNTKSGPESNEMSGGRTTAETEHTN
jgi:dTDP-4-amino-4,6-dideoxygalactose transaminase